MSSESSYGFLMPEMTGGEGGIFPLFGCIHLKTMTYINIYLWFCPMILSIFSSKKYP